VIVPQEDGPLVDQLDDLGVQYSVLGMPRGLFSMSRSQPVRSLVSTALAWPTMRNYLARMNKLLGMHRPHVIHTAGLRSHDFSARLDTDIPVLWHLQEVLEQGTTRLLLRRQRAASDAYVLADSYSTATSFDPEEDRPWVVFHGVDRERFKPGQSPIFRDRFRIPAQTPVIGAVGSIEPGRGLDHFIEMAAILRSSEVEARFVIVGDGIDGAARDEAFKASLEQRVDDLGLSGVLAFVGFHQDRVRVMQGLDVLVDADPRSVTVDRGSVEAMACGVPVVATAIGGSLEVIDDRVCGRLVPPGDPRAIAQAVYDLVSDDQLRQGCVDAGCERVRQRFSLDRSVHGVIRAYDRVLLGRSGS